MWKRSLTTAATEKDVYTHFSPRAPGSYPHSPARQRRLALRAGVGDGQQASLERGPHAYNKEATAMMLGRRTFMITGAAAADGGAGGGAAWAAETPIRYPDPNIKVLDPRFQRY